MFEQIDELAKNIDEGNLEKLKEEVYAYLDEHYGVDTAFDRVVELVEAHKYHMKGAVACMAGNDPDKAKDELNQAKDTLQYLSRFIMEAANKF